ncbi:MAG: transposase, partial [Sphingomonadales bacterium]|nr:transposase [Sphingomonadales bacterium]
FDEMTAVLTERGLLLRQGTIVDATLIAAPPSTTNRTKSRDPDMKQTRKGQKLTDEQCRINRLTSGFRSKVEHVFRVVKRQFGYTKTRYRGLYKNSQQIFCQLTLANIYMMRAHLACPEG